MISVNSMLRAEPLAYFAIISAIDVADEVIIANTGPTDDIYYEPLLFLSQKFPKIVLQNYEIDSDAHCWENKEKGIDKVNEKAGIQLGDIRRKSHCNSTGDIIYVVDGDEVISDNFALKIKYSIVPYFSSQDHLVAAHFPFVDFLDKDHVRLYHNMGRLFKKDRTELLGNYPTEMDYNKEIPEGPKPPVSTEELDKSIDKTVQDLSVA